MIYLAINIKQVKGSENLIAQAAFVLRTAAGGSAGGDNDDPDSPSQPTDSNSFVIKQYVDDQIAAIKGTATAQGDTLGELESDITTIKNTLTNQRVTVSADQTTGTKIGTVTVGNNSVEFRINLSSYAPLNSPSFSGAPTTTTPATNSDSTQLATTAFVQRIKESLLGTVSTTLNTLEKISAAINDDPDYYKTMTTALGTKLNSADIAVTGSSGEGTVIGTISLGSNTYDFKVDLSPYALLNSPTFTGVPSAPTAAQGVNTTQVATTAFVNTAINNLKGSDLSTSLNTLKKIATSINNDAAFATTMNTALSGKQPLHAALTSISGLTTAANKMIYTTAANTYAVANLTATARSLLDDSTVADMRTTLDVPKRDGTDATGTWDITATNATNAVSATNATNDDGGNKISSTYLKIEDHKDPDLSPYAKTADIKQVSVTNTLSTGTRIGTITVGTVAKDINVNLAPYAPLASPTFTGTPTAPTVLDQDDDSTKVATTAFVAEAIRRLVGTSPEGLDTLQELAAAINNEPNFASALAEQLIGKQPIHAALTSISGLTTSANKMIYTTAANTYATTTLSEFARSILDDTSAATVRNTIGALGKSENAVSATSATTAAACTGNSATATNATNDADGNLISTTYVKVGNLHNLTTVNNLGWTNQNAGKVVTPSLNSLAYWNGRYNSSTSNLAYCNKGAFGDIVTHSASDFLTQAQADTLYRNIDYSPDLTDYLTKADAVLNYLGINDKAKDSDLADYATTAATCSGNAATATILRTARNIGIKDADATNTGTGADFDGSNAITQIPLLNLKQHAVLISKIVMALTQEQKSILTETLLQCSTLNFLQLLKLL